MQLARRAKVPLLAAVALLLSPFLGSASAAPEPKTLEDAKSDLRALNRKVKDKKKGNEDINASITAVGADFFNIAPPPAKPAGDANDPAVKEWDAKYKDYPRLVKEWQAEALQALLKGVRVVEYDGKTKENKRNDVNLKAAQVLGEILGSADLAKGRDAKEVERARSDMAKELMQVIGTEFGKPKPGTDFKVPVGVLESTFAALARTNDIAALEWLAKEYIHTRNGEFEEERLVAAHKAMVLFTNPPGKLRLQIVNAMIVAYGGSEASALQGQNDPKKQAAKQFWDKVKTTVVAAINYFATAPGGGPPQSADGQGMTTVKDLAEWFRKNDKPNKAPWLDPPKPEPK